MADGPGGDDRALGFGLKLLVNALDLVSKALFCYLLGLTGYIFIFFKMQERVHTFLPGGEEQRELEVQFEWCFWFMVGAKLAYMLAKIYFEQCSFDIVLIDWERPKVHQHTFMRQEGGQNAPMNPLMEPESKVDVNAWRSLFLLNEFNEMQTYRLISSELTLILYGLFMEGFGWKYLDSTDPYFNPLSSGSTTAPRHFALFLLVTTIVIYGIGVAQYALRYLASQCKPLRTVEFVDMCAVSNISILMFDESFQGYYIHGQSPFGYAEVSAERLRKSLEFEASGKAQIRGLSQEDPELQTFEIFFPPDLLRQYRRQLQGK